MLRDRKLEPGRVVVLRLTGAQDVIGSVGSVDDRSVRLRRPMLVVVAPGNGPGQMMVAFAPFSPVADPEEVTVDVSHIVAVMSPTPDAERAYRSQTSGLTIPHGLVVPGNDGGSPTS